MTFPSDRKEKLYHPLERLLGESENLEHFDLTNQMNVKLLESKHNLDYDL